jgi:hypothetical protein
MENQEIKPNNPSAFPVSDHRWSDGMTLRDYFANSAMKGIIERNEISYGYSSTYDSIAERAYKMADAMLKQRGL